MVSDEYTASSSVGQYYIVGYDTVCAEFVGLLMLTFVNQHATCLMMD